MPSPLMELWKRLAIGVIGQALPKAPALSRLLKDFIRCLCVSVALAVFCCSLILTGCYALYYYLLAQAVPPLSALLAVSALLVALIGICCLLLNTYLSRLSRARARIGFFPKEREKEEPPLQMEALLLAFIEGMCEQDAAETVTPPTGKTHNVYSMPQSRNKQDNDTIRY